MADLILIGGEQENQAVKTDGICTCLTSSMGMGGGYVPLVMFITRKEKKYKKKSFVRSFELRRDEGGVRLWNDSCMGTLRTIEACGEKYIVEKYE